MRLPLNDLSEGPFDAVSDFCNKHVRSSGRVYLVLLATGDTTLVQLMCPFVNVDGASHLLGYSELQNVSTFGLGEFETTPRGPNRVGVCRKRLYSRNIVVITSPSLSCS